MTFSVALGRTRQQAARTYKQEAGGSIPSPPSVLDSNKAAMLSELTRILYPFCTHLSWSHMTLADRICLSRANIT
jgi:hypothetical protein